MSKLDEITRNTTNSVAGIKMKTGEMVIAVIAKLESNEVFRGDEKSIELISPFLLMLGQNQVGLAPWIPTPMKDLEGEAIVVEFDDVMFSFQVVGDLVSHYRRTIGIDKVLVAGSPTSGPIRLV